MRRTVLSVLVALVAVVLLSSAVLARGGTSTVTRPRLERSLSATFANLYVQQSHVLGRHDLTPDSLHARAMCDKHGPDVADVGPGGDWVCLVGWDDPKQPLPPEGYGKFELNVHSNDCYTVSGPSKLTGFLTITDTAGKEVTNPVFEFDGCFDPAGDDSPTGVEFPSLLSLTSTGLTPDDQGRVGVQVSCGPGSDGCSGTMVATAAGHRLGQAPFDVAEQSTSTITFPTAVPPGAGEVSFEVTTTTGIGPTSPASIDVQESTATAGAAAPVE
ncbi:hypothetical protein [Nocardioides sp.]|uniref:hypothetical protein n=1 Tax=Nocardioides sp. TaxID=35761 RepID=UPI00286C3707|nr:hypothetical protein [Nocardioides sp.]